MYTAYRKFPREQLFRESRARSSIDAGLAGPRRARRRRPNGHGVVAIVWGLGGTMLMLGCAAGRGRTRNPARGGAGW
jgi:hypothetical protein